MSLTPAQILVESGFINTRDYLESYSPVLAYSSTHEYHQAFFAKETEYTLNRSMASLFSEHLETTKKPLVDIIKSIKNFVEFGSSPYCDPSFEEDRTLYFPGVRYLTPGIVVFERPPTYQHLSLSLAYREEVDEDTGLRDYYIPIPWQVYIASYNPQDMRLFNVRMYFTSSSLYSSDQHVYAPPLFNFFSNGKLCRPFFENSEDIEKYPQNVSGIIASAYDWIWNSGFNLDITENISYFLLTKKYKQFEKYMNTLQQKGSYAFLDQHQITNIPRSLPPSYLDSFFTCWQAIPIEDISSIVWSLYSDTDFFYQESVSSAAEAYIQDYLDQHDLVLHEDNEEDHYDEDGDNYCPDNCITRQDLFSSSDFINYISTKTLGKSIKPALSSAVAEIAQSKLSQVAMSLTAFRKRFYESSV